MERACTITELREEIKNKEALIKNKETIIEEKEKRLLAVESGNFPALNLEEKSNFLRQDILYVRQEIEHIMQDIHCRDLQILKILQDPPPAGLETEGLLRSIEEKIKSLPEELGRIFRNLSTDKVNRRRISDIGSTDWGNVVSKVGLDIQVWQGDFPTTFHQGSVRVFTWDSRLERAHSDKYIPFLQTYLGVQNIHIVDAANKCPELLNFRGFGYDFRGTTDVVFVNNLILPQVGLKCLMELKMTEAQVLSKRSQTQVLLSLVLANVHSKKLKPVAVITDLRNTWILYWMDKMSIYFYRFQGSRDAVGTLRQILGESMEEEISRGKPRKVAKRKNDLIETVVRKRQKFSPPEMEPLEDLQGTISDEELDESQAVIGVKQLIATPTFRLLLMETQGFPAPLGLYT